MIISVEIKERRCFYLLFLKNDIYFEKIHNFEFFNVEKEMIYFFCISLKCFALERFLPTTNF